MPKMAKTSTEIEKLAMQAPAKIRECEGLTDLTIQPIADDRVDYNWTVSHAHNCPGKLCEIAIETVIEGMQRGIELDHSKAQP
jgi:hypothetical protein